MHPLIPSGPASESDEIVNPDRSFSVLPLREGIRSRIRSVPSLVYEAREPSRKKRPGGPKKRVVGEEWWVVGYEKRSGFTLHRPPTTLHPLRKNSDRLLLNGLKKRYKGGIREAGDPWRK